MNNLKHFTDLFVWQKGHQVVLATYQLTKQFPSEEKYGLKSQMQRCAVSITSNIAESFGRRSKKEKIQFLYISLGSCYELENQLIITQDIGLTDATLETVE